MNGFFELRPVMEFRPTDHKNLAFTTGSLHVIETVFCSQVVVSTFPFTGSQSPLLVLLLQRHHLCKWNRPIVSTPPVLSPSNLHQIFATPSKSVIPFKNFCLCKIYYFHSAQRSWSESRSGLSIRPSVRPFVRYRLSLTSLLPKCWLI